LQRLTEDHTAAAVLAKKLNRSVDSLPANYQNELTKFVGPTDSVSLDKNSIEVQSGDLFLLCCDGLTKMISEEAISSILKERAGGPLPEVARDLIDKANAAGGTDNITVVLVKIGDISSLPKMAEPEEEVAETVEVEAAAKAHGESPVTPSTPGTLEANTPHTDDNPSPRTPTTEKTDQAATDGVATARERPGAPEKPRPPTTESVETSSPPTRQSEPVEAVKAKVLPVIGNRTIVLGIAGVAVLFLIGIFLFGGGKSKTRRTGQSPASLAESQAASNQTATASGTTRPAASSDLPDNERAYQTLLSGARGALAQQSFDQAIAQATEALKLRPNDKNASELLATAKKALEADASYKSAMAAARAGIRGGAYDDAIKQAQAAKDLRPGDPAAESLLAEAAKGRGDKMASETTLAAARAALANEDFDAAIKQANMVLASLPQDTNAQALLTQATQAKQSKTDYTKALGSGLAALRSKDYKAANAAAGDALKLRPDSQEAKELRQQSADGPDLDSAQSAFVQGDYNAASALCQKHAGAESFKQLAASIAVESKALQAAKQQFDQGDYAFIQTTKTQSYGAKPVFAKLVTSGETEKKLLEDLKTFQQATNWQAVSKQLSDPALAQKPPFAELNQWANRLGVKAKSNTSLDQININFEKMLVWFNIKKATDVYIQTAEARKETRLDGELGTQRDKYIQMVAQFETEFKKAGWLEERDRAKYLKELKETILHRE